MIFINKIVQFFLLLSIILLVYALSITNTLSSTQNLTGLLDKSGFYSGLSSGLSVQLKNQIVGNDANAQLTKKSIDMAITPEAVKSIMQPSQIAFVGWLNESSNSLEIKIDFSTAKEKIASKSDNAGVRFEIAKILPDTLELTQTKNESSRAVLTGLDRFKTFYRFVVTALPALWAVTAVCSLLIFMLNVTKGSKKLSRIFSVLMAAGIVGIVIAQFSKFLLSFVKIEKFDSFSVVDSALIARLVVTIISDTFLIFCTIAIAGVLGIFVSKILFRSSDKKIKEKK